MEVPLVGTHFDEPAYKIQTFHIGYSLDIWEIYNIELCTCCPAAYREAGADVAPVC